LSGWHGPAAYLAKVLGQVVPTLFLLSVAAFGLTTVARGDPALIALQQDGQTPTPELLASYRVQLGLDDPLPVRYAHWLAAVLHGDLGRSLLSNRPVSQMLGERILPTLLLAGTALVLSTICGLLIGAALASAHGSTAEFAARAGLTLLASVPAFWLSIALIVLLGERWHVLPVAGYGTWQQLVMPTVALAVAPAAALARLTRGQLLESRYEDYVRTAHAKGLPPSSVTQRHVLRNAAVPLVAMTGVRLGHVLGGAVIIETIFGWPGIGSVLVGAISGRDLPVICGFVLLTGTLVIASRVLTDAVAAVLDPRFLAGAR
jgi:ABC-type dipeptide/oligopeptide/nickel transport system permease component